jgi:hypothetical protein
MYYSSPDVISILATRWQQSMCNLLDWSEGPIWILFKMLYKDCPNVPSLFINNSSCWKLCTLLKQ